MKILRVLFFQTIYNQFLKTKAFFDTHKDLFMYYNHYSQDDDVIVKYVNCKGEVGINLFDQYDFPSVVERNKLSFEDLEYVYIQENELNKDFDGYKFEDYPKFIISHEGIKKAMISVVADTYAKKGYSHKAVTWALWNQAAFDWVCPVAQKSYFHEDVRKKELQQKVEFLKIKKMCQSLIDTFGETAVREVTFTGIDAVDHGYMIYDLKTATKCGVEVNCWSSSQWGGTCNCYNHPASFDVPMTEMTVEDVKKVEEILSKEKNSGYEKTTVNGIEISVGWDKGYGEYTIYFPQIEIGDAARKKSVSDQVLRISEDLNQVKEIFDYSVKIAETESDVYKVYVKVFDFLINNIHIIPRK